MKKILSLILALTMVSTIVMTLFVGVSAANGDLLWEADFKSVAAPYAPGMLVGDVANLTVTPSADGKSVSFAPNGAAKNAFAWGAAVDTLKITADTKYTIDFACKNTTANGNIAVTFLTGNAADPYKSWHTLYGNYAVGQSLNINISSSSNKGFPGVAMGHAHDADGYSTFKIEINGYDIRIYCLDASGKYILGGTYSIFESDRETAAIACGFFGWLSGNGKASTLDIKYFKVSQGTALTDADLAVDYAATGLGSAYKSAKNGALVWSANFNGDAYFKPATTGTTANRGNLTITPSADGKSVAVGAGAAAGAGFYAGIVDGLAITEDTEYTVEFKLKNDGNYGGVIFYGTPRYGNVYNSYVSYYTGNGLTDVQNTIARGGNTANYTASWQMGNAYVKSTDRVLDADGYWDIKIEIDGYNVKAYYMTADGYKVGYEYTMDDKDAVIACGTYNYQPTATTTIKYFNVYKGLTVTNDYSKVTEAPETTAPETQAPETQAPTTTPVTPSNPNTGDNAVISVIVAAIAVTALGAAVVTKKSRA